MIRLHTKKLLLTLLLVAGITLMYCGAVLIGDENVSFSHPSGFYDDGFELKINCGAIYDIYYTLDGSEPTENSLRYQRGEPIQIVDATPNPNQYTVNTDISTGYYLDLIEESGAFHYDYDTTDQCVDKCTVIRAAAFYKGQRVGESVCGVYFVGWQNRADYDDVYIVSLVADPDDLFGYEDGIMVTGKAFADYAAKMSEGEGLSSKWWWWLANYRKSGIEWERRAIITVFNQNRKIEMDQSCGIRIHGGASRAFPLKSIRCYARQEYARLDVFDTDWFGEDISPSKFLLFSGGNDAGGGSTCLNLKDYMISSLAQDMDFATMDFIPCALFINGEFWGLYHISEHYNAKYIADHYNVHENNVVMIKNGAVAEGPDSGKQLYSDMQEAISQSDMTVAENYRAACELIDIDSYIDYYAYMIYIARTGDWPTSNYALWRTIEQENSAYGDGKWRWMLFDVNSAGMAAVDTVLVEDDTLQMVLENDPMFASLFQNLEFQQKFAERMLYVGSTVLSSEKCSAFIDAYFADYSGLQESTNTHVYNDTREEELAAYRENMELFFSGRYAVVCGLLEKHLDPAVASSLGS